MSGKTVYVLHTPLFMFSNWLYLLFGKRKLIQRQTNPVAKMHSIYNNFVEGPETLWLTTNNVKEWI